MSEKPINIYIFQPENRENTSNKTIVPSKNTITEIGMISPTVEKQNPT